MAELVIKEEQRGDVVVLHMKGKITIGEGSVAMRVAVRNSLEAGAKKFIWNLSGVSYIDSSGIGEIVSSYTAVSKHGGTVVLCHLTEKVEDLLAGRKLLTVFDVYDDMTHALASLSVPHRFFLCPLDGCGKSAVLPHSTPNCLSLTCSACDAHFELKLPPVDNSRPTHCVIRSLRIPAYWQEYINVIIGLPSIN